MNIKGKFVTLRAMEIEDLELLRTMINDPEMESMVGGYSLPVSTLQQEQWIINNGNTSMNIRLIIETEDDGAVGLANIVNIDWKNRTAFHGIKIANRKFRSKGIGTDAVMAVMKYAFEELQLNRLDGTILEYNKLSKILYCDKCGWIIEGVKRQAVFKANEYHNELMVGILKKEYEDLIEKNNYWDN